MENKVDDLKPRLTQSRKDAKRSKDLKTFFEISYRLRVSRERGERARGDIKKDFKDLLSTENTESTEVESKEGA